MIPDPRPRRDRATVRVLLLDPRHRLLLLLDSDTGLDDATWWMTPGGGIDPGEDVVRAAIRELAEETGLQVGAEDVLGPVATVRVTHGYSDKIIDQLDTYVLVRADTFEIDTSGFTEDERRTVLGNRWWSQDEVLATPETVWPVTLLQLWEALATPESWPLSLPDAEESTVPVG